MSATDDRRQAAFSLFEKGVLGQRVADGAMEAIEVATQVKITDEVVEAALRPVKAYIYANELRAILREALPALGFEVIE